MKSDRIKMLEQFVADDPKDPFNHYALALELMKSNKEEARKIFEYLISKYPNYVPSYYQSALLLLEVSQNEEAVKIIEKGIAEAKKQNNLKAAGELRLLLDEM